ncbi:hypothetical protein LLH23_08120 [bacterium]|nr:hypothetical protein [bacterium]
MAQTASTPPPTTPRVAAMVLYCLIRRRSEDGRAERLLLLRKPTGWTFPPTKLRANEDLYTALVRPLGEDLALPSGSYFPERELPVIPSDMSGPRYAGLPERWYLCPVDISLTAAGEAWLDGFGDQVRWLTAAEILAEVPEPNIRAIVESLSTAKPPLGEPFARPSMDALATHWAASNEGGVRVARECEIHDILAAGTRAFNLRVADPYLPYQRQGLGFTWSFFTPKDKQDVHVHGLPAVEIYGVLEGRLHLWHKPMNQRGVRTWRHLALEAGDWAEVDALECHFACWAGTEGLGVVFKSAGPGELAGVGRLGESGKTVCGECPARTTCLIHPRLAELAAEYNKAFAERDHEHVARLLSEDTAV